MHLYHVFTFHVKNFAFALEFFWPPYSIVVIIIIIIIILATNLAS